MYHVGGMYNCANYARHDELRVKCEEWLSKGMIKIYPLAPGEIFKTVKF